MRITNGTTLLAISVLLLATICTAAVGKTIYVDDDATGINDGSGWVNAYNYLQDALAAANLADKPVEIRVAQGTYKPDENSASPDGAGNRDARFQLINNVTITGGYAGFGETDPNARDIEVFETILSGDLSGNDIDVNDPCDLRDVPNRGDNSRNVVSGSNTDATAILDGFTITGGDVWVISFGGLHAGGAGMFVFSGSPTLIDCTFTGNATQNSGGGLLLYDNSNPTLLNCKFMRNYAPSGGGIFGSASSSPTLINCIFSDNYTTNRGGGMFIAGGNPILTNCTFSRNSAFRRYYGTDTGGGGMYNRNSSPVLTNCTFSENSTVFGGAMLNIDSNTMLNMCEFIGNTASRQGGAILNDGGQLVAKGCVFEKNYPGAVEDGDSSGPTFTDCTFSGNSSRFDGGAVRVAMATFNHCIFAGNVALGGHSTGGAVFSLSTVAFNNCTFSNNRADSGCAIYCDGMAYVNNCIFWGSEDQIFVHEPADLLMFVDYSDIQGGWPGEGNIDADPCFAEPGYWADANDLNIAAEPNDPNAIWVDGDYHLKSQAGRWDPKSGTWVQDDVTSPCIDAGDPNSPIGQEPFPNGGVVNMGAYGGTAQASKSYFGGPPCDTITAGDINGDCKVDFSDFAIMALHWLEDNNP
ncbi:MAG: right-handed parallel beta-helix repeat-containing protein [Planctomycetota bacterium]|jgi:parallel beta-helix repeat protein/predicted outer membrane repeat protein